MHLRRTWLTFLQNQLPARAKASNILLDRDLRRACNLLETQRQNLLLRNVRHFLSNEQQRSYDNRIPLLVEAISDQHPGNLLNVPAP